MASIAILGANGRTGRLIVTQSLAAGHTVTALVRNPSGSGSPHPRLAVIGFDILSPTETTAADTAGGGVSSGARGPDAQGPGTQEWGLGGVLAGHDVVVSAVGAAGRGATTVYSGIAAALVGALPAGARVMVISSAGLGVPAGAGPVTRLGARVLHQVMRHVYDDMERMERILAESDLDWTAMRPTGLNDAPARGNPRVSVGATGRVSSRTSRGDLAAYIVAHLTDPATFRQPVAISS